MPTVNHVVNFLQTEYKLSDFPFTALDRSFIEKYVLYLRSECNLSQSSIVNLSVMLKTVVGEAIADGIITANPFIGYELPKNCAVSWLRLCITGLFIMCGICFSFHASQESHILTCAFCQMNICPLRKTEYGG